MGGEELRFTSFASMVYGIDEQQSAFTVLQNEPTRISGRDGFRVRIAYKIQRELEMLQEVFGVTDRDSYYELSYVAPKLYYFEKYEPDFVKAVESFKLAGTKPTGVQPSIDASRPSAAAPVAPPVVTSALSREIPTALPAESSNLPKIGDRWIYQLSDRRRVLGMVDVAIVETSAAGVKERITREGYPSFGVERSVEANFNPVRFQPAIVLPGGYPLWEIAPYFPLGTQLSMGQSWGPIAGEFNIPTFGKRTLTTRVRVVSRSKVGVPAGEFDAWRVETEPATVGTGGTSAVVTCTFWYSPQSLRTVKMQYDTAYNFWGQPTSEIYELSRFEPAK